MCNFARCVLLFALKRFSVFESISLTLASAFAFAFASALFRSNSCSSIVNKDMHDVGVAGPGADRA
jgi:hypothetical protein